MVISVNLIILAIATLLLQIGSHFFPWAGLIAKPKINRLAAYTIGTLTIGAILTVYSILTGAITIVTVWIVIIASGAGVYTGYAIDWLIETRANRRELKQENRLLKDQR